MEARLKKLLQGLNRTANVAKDEAISAVHTASKALTNTTESAKLRVELFGAQAELEDIFCEIGRTLYLMNSDDYLAASEDVQHSEVAKLLLEADEIQQKIDSINDRLKKEPDGNVCPQCDHVCEADASFCPKCGEKLTTPAEDTCCCCGGECACGDECKCDDTCECGDNCTCNEEKSCQCDTEPTCNCGE